VTPAVANTAALDTWAASGRIPEAKLATTRDENLILADLDMTFLSERMVAMPSKFYAAVSVVCDIVCPFCPRQYQGELTDHGIMSFEAFGKVAPALKFADFAGLFGLGEPFLHKDFFGFLKAAKRVGAWTTTSSHGMSLNRDVCSRLIDEGLDNISCSMDGATKETFEFLRAGAHFETVCANLKGLAALKKERGVKHPEVQIACTISRHNVKQMVQMVELAKELGADEQVFSDLIIINPDNENLSVCFTPEFRQNLAAAKKRAAELGIRFNYFHQNPFPWVAEPRYPDADGDRFGCWEAWRTITIERRGAVKPCCYVEQPVGNAFETDMEELRNSKDYVELRREMIEGRPNDFCRNCGNLVKSNPEHVTRYVAAAKKRLAETNLPDARRAELTELVEQYTHRAQELGLWDPSLVTDAVTEPHRSPDAGPAKYR